MSYTVPIVGAAVIIGLAGVLYTTIIDQDQSITSSSVTEELETIQSSSPLENKDSAIKFSVQKVSAVEDSTPLENEDTNEALTSIQSVSETSIFESIDFAQSIAREKMSDEILSEYIEVLRNDPAKLSAVLNEFSAETDAYRLSQLRLLLGQLDDPSLVGVAESMLSSGNPQSSNEALKLLRDIGPNVPEALDVGLNILTSTQDPELLIGATNIFTSSEIADTETTQQVVTSLTTLVQHADASVRRISYSMLARWSNDPADTAVLLQGLEDTDPTVRRNAVYAFVDYANADASVISALLNTAGNTSENLRVRQGAIRALKGMSLDDSQQARLQAVQSQL